MRSAAAVQQPGARASLLARAASSRFVSGSLAVRARPATQRR